MRRFHSVGQGRHLLGSSSAATCFPGAQSPPPPPQPPPPQPLLSPPPSLPPPSPPKRELSLSELLGDESLSAELPCRSLPQCTTVLPALLSARRRRDWQSAT